MALRDFQGEGVDRFTDHLTARLGLPAPGELAGGPILQARVNHGRWIVDCPNCFGAELADVDDLRFYCLSCGNRDVGHRWLQVKLPPNRTRIEELLLRRLQPGNRNWHPGESVAQLERENRLMEVQ